MDTIEHAIRRARNEWRRQGALSLSTVMELQALGLDVMAVEHDFANEELESSK